MKSPLRRWLPLAGLAALLAGTAALPAHAAPEDGSISVYFPKTLIAPGSAGGEARVVIFAHDATLAVHSPGFSVDFTGVKDFAKVSAESHGCSVKDSVLTCTSEVPVFFGEEGLQLAPELLVEPLPGAEAGDTGPVKVSFFGQGVGPITYESSISVAEGVDLAGAREERAQGVPGGTFDHHFEVSNTGETEADGAVLAFYGEYPLRATDVRHSNCLYVDDELAACLFDEKLAAGGRYASDTTALGLRPDTKAPGTVYAQMEWMTPAEWDLWLDYLKSRGVSPEFKAGAGDKLKLNLVESQPRGAQVDVDPENNWTYLAVKVNGQNGVDFAAVGAEVTGEVGDTATIEVGLANKGPASAGGDNSGEPVARVAVGIPAGLTVTKASEECYAITGEDEGDWENPGKPGARAYWCYAGTLLEAGDQQLFPFTLRIEEGTPAAGEVVLTDLGGQAVDGNSANDKAAIKFATAGGGLPVTGVQVGLITAVGAVLVGAGVLALRLGRRRRITA